MKTRPQRRVIAILGGGFSGAAIAFHLARTAGDAVDIVVVEPRAGLGGGLAYSTTDPAHRINVPAARMSLIAAEPERFAEWLARTGALAGDPAAVTSDGHAFPQRGVFARYVRDQLAPFVAAGIVRHERNTATSAERVATSWRIGLAEGGPLEADFVVLAMTHPLPAVPTPLAPLAGGAKFIADPYDPALLDRIAADNSVLIVGAGLTAADIVASLTGRGHRGRVLMLSRRGLLSKAHAPAPADPIGGFAPAASKSARALLRSIRAKVAEAEMRGLTWHPVLDAVRNEGPDIWAALAPIERRRLVRHLRVFWDVHRFRVAPQPAAAIAAGQAEGRLAVVAARLVDAARDGDRLVVRFQRRGTGASEKQVFDAVIVATGPAHGTVIAQNPVFASLARQGLLVPDAVGLGLATSAAGRALDAAGRPVPTLLVGGPLARGTFGELMGLQEVTRYAEFVAGELAGALVHAVGAGARAAG